MQSNAPTARHGQVYRCKWATAILLCLVHAALVVHLSMQPHLAVYLNLSIWIAFLSQVLVVALIPLEQQSLVVGSSTLNVYWLLQLLAFAVQLQSFIRRHVYDHDILRFSALVAFIGLTLILIVLDNWPSAASTSSYMPLDGSDADHPLCPELRANFFSRITFSWMNSIMVLGFKKPLAEEDLWSLKHDDDAHAVSIRFQQAWKQELRSHKPSLVGALAHSVCGPFFFATFFKLFQDLLQFVQPLLLSALMDFIKDWRDEKIEASQRPPASYGFTLACLMLGLAIIQSSMLHQYFHRCLVSGMRLRAALVTAIYKKALRLSNTSRQRSTVGEVVNHMSVDAQRLMDLMGYLQILWSGPLQITLALVFLYRTMGPAIFAGVGVMIAMIPVNAVLAIRQRKLQKQQMKNKDGRIKLMEEILSGIKVIKLYAWEKVYQEKIDVVREAELSTLKSIGFLSAFQSLTWSCTPFMVSFASFGLYCAIESEPLTPKKIFVSLSLFNLLQFPLNMFPNVISSVVEASVALNRLYQFLTSEELDADSTVREYNVKSGSSCGISASHVSYRWAPDGEDILQDISFNVGPKTLLGVVGKVGAGKSSLISAILGVMYKSSGSQSQLHVRGSIAYVGQQAWIMNATLRENILFGQHYDEKLYRTTIESCGLKPDIEMLPAGDMTEIGERGINLSGGQKQRISLARAMYSLADIYLLDDPLSAVDAHVGRHIFDKVIGINGFLKNKTRLFVTHAIQYVPECDAIMMVDQGRIVEGPESFNSLVSRKDQSLIWKLVNEFLSERYSAESTVDNESVDLEQLDELADLAGIPLASSVQSLKSQTSNARSSTPVKRIASTVVSKRSSPEPKPSDANNGRLMAKEESAKGSVSKAVYLSYAKACSLTATIAVVVMMIIGQLASTGSDVWLEYWSSLNSRPGGAPESGWFYLGIYGAFGLLFAIIVVAQVIVIWVFCAIRSSRVLHHDLLRSVMRSPMAFFDTTPLGRIVNRFSKDIYTLDEVLPRSFMSFFRTFFSVTAIFAVIIFSTPLFLALILPMGIIYFFVQRYYLASSRELKRLDSVSRSPICMSSTM